jgi:glycosyltransferase involved in cell wall biosynthesis
MKNKIEKISIIMSVKNGERFAAAAIESILNQSFKNFEFIIVNNDSSDNTYKILESYQNKDPRIKILTNSNNETLYEGRMTGIKVSKFDWFALMDADDECDKNRIQEQIDFINNHSSDNLGVVSTYGNYINYKSKIIANRFTGPINEKEFNKIYLNNESFSLIDPSIVVNKNIFFKVGGYLKDNIAADLDLFYKIAEKGFLIQTVNKPLYFYRVHETSYSVQNSMKQCEITHYLNYNMRQRRNGRNEISEKEFYNNFWKKFNYRIPRKILDYSKTFYKISAHNFIQKKYFYSLLNVIFAFIFSPRYTLLRLYQHLFR